MGLFSKLFRFLFDRHQIFSERELVFNRTRLQEDLVKHSARLYEYRGDQSHKVYSDYLRSLLNLEILKLSESRPTTMDAYAYQRGKIDALRLSLDLREKYIQDKQVAKETGSQEAKRTYLRPPATHAGLA